MGDLVELQRSVIRVPVAGPAPNNTLVFVRGSFAGASNWQKGGKIYREPAYGMTLFQIDGFQQSKAQFYIDNTKISITGYIAHYECSDDQSFLTAVDEIEGRISESGVFWCLAKVASMIDDEISGVTFNMSAYILTSEPHSEDFALPQSHRFTTPLSEIEMVRSYRLPNSKAQELGAQFTGALDPRAIAANRRALRDPCRKG